MHPVSAGYRAASFRFRPARFRHQPIRDTWRCDSRSHWTRTSTDSAWTSSRCAGLAPRSSCTWITGAACRAGHTHRCPFYVSTKGYGVFVDASRYITVSVGVGVRLAATAKPPVVDRTTHAERLGRHAPIGCRRNARPRSRRGRLRVRGTDHDGRGPPLQPVRRRRSAAAEVGPRLHDADTARVHGLTGARRDRGVQEPRDPARHDRTGAGVARSRLPHVLRVGPDAVLESSRVPREARSAPRPSQSLVQPLRVADGSALREASAVRGFTPGLEWHRARLLDAGGADDLCRSLALEDRRTPSARVGRIQDR